MTVWSTPDGSSQGHIKSTCELLCCDISHSKVFVIVVTLETDGEIRLFTKQGANRQAAWIFFTSISPQLFVEPIVEVKLERSVLLAVTHSEDGASGTIHTWEIHLKGSEGPLESPAATLQNHCFLECDRAPDRVEARHGGQFIEAFFLVDSVNPRPPDGIYDIQWFSPKMERLFELHGGIGDWRCDLRDALAWLEDDTTVSWLPLWGPIF